MIEADFGFSGFRRCDDVTTNNLTKLFLLAGLRLISKVGMSRRLVCLTVLAVAAADAEAPYTCINAYNDGFDTDYSVTISVGSPPQHLLAVPDTGSTQLVVASKQCIHCEGHCMGESRGAGT